MYVYECVSMCVCMCVHVWVCMCISTSHPWLSNIPMYGDGSILFPISLVVRYSSSSHFWLAPTALLWFVTKLYENVFNSLDYNSRNWIAGPHGNYVKLLSNVTVGWGRHHHFTVPVLDMRVPQVFTSLYLFNYSYPNSCVCVCVCVCGGGGGPGFNIYFL